ncbi:hypothetical protein [Dysgonomonas sp. BGC7]|uniref:hypothetical protein n=1 Tax=Dysgonomonas sp. BGC7 TaxID=1658008 RepID=UPI000AE78B2E|nr:hypothetical protein [Dysgonomonas sp. BGC7]
MNLKTKNIFFQIAAILILIAASMYSFNTIIAKYMMIVGVAGFAAVVFTSPYKGKSLRGKRMFNIQILAVLLMAVSTYLMFVDMSAWPVTLLIAALLTLYCSIILPKIYNKEKEGD